MKTLIISGGTLEDDFVLQYIQVDSANKPNLFSGVPGYDCVIAADSGIDFFYRNKLMPTHLVGDFDSAGGEALEFFKGQEQIQVRRYNPVKDATDTQIAVELALSLGSSEIDVLGAFGTRIDHLFGNIQTLMLPLQKNIPCRLVDQFNRITLLASGIKIAKHGQYGDYISLVPLGGQVTGLTLKGFKYPLDGHLLKAEDAGLGISNEIIEKEAEIIFTSGCLLLIESKDD